MVDPRVIHSVTIEMCTGFLLLAGVAAAAKMLADAWLKYVGGRTTTLDKWAMLTSRLGDPASYFALGAGVIATFVSMVTGMMAWPFDQLAQSETVHNKILITATSQTIFIGAFAIRHRFKYEVWMTRGTTWAYVLMVLAGDGLMTLQNSIAGHLAGKGSLLDEIMGYLGIDTYRMWVFPGWVQLPIAVLFPLATLIVWARLRAWERRATKAVAA